MSAPLLFLAAGLSPAALATAGFDPETPAASFEGEETWDQDGELKLWSRVERIADPDRTLFTQEAFNEALRWPDRADWAPWIAQAFATNTPHSSTALLHMGINEPVAEGTPILLVPGAGDNGVRAFVTMATRLDRGLRPVYALTFAHPHGDVFQQAEIVADAIDRIKARTGAGQVDVVAHSKGGIAAAVYMSHNGTGWGDAGYDAVGTAYRGDVRRAVFVATPLGGIDTAFRWPTMNLTALDAQAALSPTSWTAWYPYTTANLAVFEDLEDQHIAADGADYFPGHRQILARWDDRYQLPGSYTWLGGYALQPDWYTTYEGGFGYQSYSPGITAAIEAGGDLIGQLRARGVDPDIELFLLAGNNPLMPNGSEDWLASTFDAAWVEAWTGTMDDWGALAADIVGNSLADLGISEGEIQGLAGGDLVLGEITGESDGLVFVASATDAAALTRRGATVVDSAVVNLSHIDLLYASPITGELLVETAGDDPDLAWMISVGERYTEADTLGWVEAALHEEGDGLGGEDSGSGDGGAGDTGADTGDGTTTEDSGTADAGSDGGAGGGLDSGGAGVENGGCGRCSGAPAGVTGLWALLLAGAGLSRRRRH